MAKAIWGFIFAVYLLTIMSCGQTMVAQVEVDWSDDIERDRRELMAPRNPKIKPKDKTEELEKFYVYYGMADSTN